MKKITTYQCNSYTHANDSANLYYIESAAARKIVHVVKGLIEVRNKADKVLASFIY